MMKFRIFMRYLLETECLSRRLPGSGKCIKKAALPVWQSRCVFTCRGINMPDYPQKQGETAKPFRFAASSAVIRIDSRQIRATKKTDTSEIVSVRQREAKAGQREAQLAPALHAETFAAALMLPSPSNLFLDEQSLAYRHPKRKGFPTIFSKIDVLHKPPENRQCVFCRVLRRLPREVPTLSAKKERRTAYFFARQTLFHAAGLCYNEDK